MHKLQVVKKKMMTGCFALMTPKRQHETKSAEMKEKHKKIILGMGRLFFAWIIWVVRSFVRNSALCSWCCIRFLIVVENIIVCETISKILFDHLLIYFLFKLLFQWQGFIFLFCVLTLALRGIVTTVPKFVLPIKTTCCVFLCQRTKHRYRLSCQS